MNKLSKEKEHCPLCEGLNQCQSEMPQASCDGPCWCRAEKFPSALLAQLPEEERNKRCICLNCLKSFEMNQIET